MPWNPDIYNQFKNISYQPFFDLMNLIQNSNLHNAVDVGCGTGEQTKILSDKFQNTRFTGIDASAEMLAKSTQYAQQNLVFKQKTIEDFVQDQSTWDLIFSNAALQWVDHHQELFPALMAKLNSGGQFAVQMPVQTENILNQLLLELVREKPFVDYFDGFERVSPVLGIDNYAKMMFENGLESLNIIMKIYPIYAQNSDELYQFIAGSALIPYMERLNVAQLQEFTQAYMRKIEANFQHFPAIYPFKRILLYGIKK